jgi:hypothetical protein
MLRIVRCLQARVEFKSKINEAKEMKIFSIEKLFITPEMENVKSLLKNKLLGFSF